VSLAPLIVAVVLSLGAPGRPLRRAFLLGVLSGSAFFLGAVYWVVAVMNTYGGLALPVAVPVALLLAAYLALYPGLFGMFVAMSVRRLGIGGVWLAPAFWVATEWLRATLLGGFPWVLLGTSQSTVLPVAQLASVTGVYGLSALVALVSTAAAMVALTPRPRHRVGAAAVALLLVIVVGAGMFRIASGSLVRQGEVLRVGLLQGNIPQDLKWDPSQQQRILDHYIDLSRQVLGAGAGLVVWPEASTPFFFDVDAAMAQPIRRLAFESRTSFLIGTDTLERAGNGREQRIFNSAVLVGPDGRSKREYRKMQLVPFGEYVPFKQILFFVGPLVEAVSDFSAGEEPVVFEDGTRRFSVAICYESVYPWISRMFVDGGSQLLMTITNDAWFGRSSAAYQHFDQGALRAIEQGRFVVRAANTGFTGAVDPYGRVLAKTALFEPAAITVDVRLLDYRTIYSRLGDVAVWLSLGLTAAVVAVPGGRRRRAVATP
jgi:apolipoprotein N-acyltransferase